MSAAPARLYSLVSMQTLVDRAPDVGGGGGRVCADDAPPTTTIAARLDRRRRRLGVDAAGHRAESRRPRPRPEGVERRLAAHLLVDRRVDRDVVGAELLGASRGRSATSTMSTMSVQHGCAPPGAP
jgi:hypothetical protein